MAIREGGRGHHRRFPHRSAADVATLDALPADAARELDLLLQTQYRDECRHRAHCTLECELGADLDYLTASSSARFSHGAGGGRHVERHEGQP